MAIGKYIGLFDHISHFKIESYYYTFIDLIFFSSNFVFLSETQFLECIFIFLIETRVSKIQT